MQRQFIVKFVAIAGLTIATCIGPDSSAHADALTESDCTITAQSGHVTNGTSGDDVICGTPGNDTVNGLDGNDTIFGEGGDDTIYGGKGNDTVDAGEGDDVVDSGAGNDTVNGDSGSDSIDVGPGDDYAYGGPGGDLLFGADGSDSLFGEAGNDSLNGQKGNDILNGGGDVDYCDGIGSDTATSCFADNSRPKLVSIAVSESSKTFNTDNALKELTIRARIKDSGLGIFHAHLVIAGGADHDVLPLGFDWRASSGGSDCSYDIDIQESPDAYACRISGNANDGVYEFHNVVKRFTPKMTYRVTGFVANDSAGNATQLNFAELKQLRLSPTLRQIGAGDQSAPALDELEIVNASINTRNSGAVVTSIVSVHDSGSGFFNGALTFYSESLRTSIVGVIGFTQSCSETTATDAMEMKMSTSCLAASSGNSRTYKTFTYFPKGTPKGTYHFNVSLFDHVENSSWYNYSRLKSITSDRKLVQTGAPIPKLPSTYSKPTVTKVTAMKTSVNTANGAALIELKVNAQDVGSVINTLELTMGRISRSSSGSCFGCGLTVTFIYFHDLETCNADRSSALTPVDMPTACLISGTRSNGVYSLKAYLPAHSASGEYLVGRVSILDAKGHRFEWVENEQEPSPLKATVHNR